VIRSEPQTLVGLDIGTNSVKLVELSQSGRGYELERLALVPVGRGEHKESAARALSMILESESVAGRRVATSVSGQHVAVRVLRFPELNKKEIEGAVWYEGSQVIAFDIDDAYVDYSVLDSVEPTDDGSPSRTDVLFVAACKPDVEWRTDLLKQNGLEPRFMGVDMLVLLEAALRDPSMPKTFAVVNVGAASTGIGVTQGGATPFVRDLEIGGNAVTEVIAGQMAISLPEAETMKVTGESWTEETERAVEDVVRRLVGEVHRSMVYYQTRSQGARVERVLLCGGSSRLSGLRESLETALSVEVEPWSPMRSISVDGSRFDVPSVEQLSPFVALAAALAMRTE